MAAFLKTKLEIVRYTYRIGADHSTAPTFKDMG
jgi:hypothetical protein